MEKGCALHERRPNTELYVITSASFNKIRLPSQQQHPVCYPHVNVTKLKLGKGSLWSMNLHLPMHGYWVKVSVLKLHVQRFPTPLSVVGRSSFGIC